MSYENLYKYPRSWHAPWSPGLQNDDRRIPSMEVFDGKRVIVTEKFDGEGTTGTRETSHARSLDSANHPSRDLVKGLMSQWRHELPDQWRVCGENVYATHSIKYRRDLGNALPSFFLGFSIWDENNQALPWDDTLAVFQTLGITPVRVLYDGIYDESLFRKMTDELDHDRVEGFVIRLAGALTYSHFMPELAKVVRKGHVGTSEHWMSQQLVPNELKTDDELEAIRSLIPTGRW